MGTIIKPIEIEFRFADGQYWKTFGGLAIAKILKVSFDSAKAEIIQGDFRQIVYYNNFSYVVDSKPHKFKVLNPRGYYQGFSAADCHPWAITELETDSRTILAAILGRRLP